MYHIYYFVIQIVNRHFNNKFKAKRNIIYTFMYTWNIFRYDQFHFTQFIYKQQEAINILYNYNEFETLMNWNLATIKIFFFASYVYFKLMF